ncbi:DUF2848 family protein [Sciscionella sediminilitoris]|uniref:DUF2848 family protein n=1 Tax=Sciscionella sediminilitoris TaxID=1445613 RepID=UPI0004DF0399|nr:DUF2848 family protein [Sciscionella sp. SE31]
MSASSFRLRPIGSEPFEVRPGRLIVAGYTARDEAAARAHIAELAEIGVPAPESIPVFFDLAPELLTTSANVPVSEANTSGEVEPVLIRHADRYYLGVGSDHTDRDLERTDIGKSKAVCPKPFGETVFALPDPIGGFDWDAVRARAEVDGLSYQDGTLAVMRKPGELLELLFEALGRIEGDLVVFCGTLPLLHGAFVPGETWELELTLPSGESLRHSYLVQRGSE